MQRSWILWRWSCLPVSQLLLVHRSLRAASGAALVHELITCTVGLCTVYCVACLLTLTSHPLHTCVFLSLWSIVRARRCCMMHLSSSVRPRGMCLDCSVQGLAFRLQRPRFGPARVLGPKQHT